MNPLNDFLWTTFGLWGYAIIPLFAGVMVAGFSEVGNKLTPEKFHVSLFLFGISVGACILLAFLFPSYYQKFDAFAIFMLLVNIMVSFLFSPTFGKAVLNKLMKKAEEKANDAIDKV